MMQLNDVPQALVTILVKLMKVLVSPYTQLKAQVQNLGLEN